VVKGVKAGQKAVVSGYHDSTGNLANNQELAKQRATSVRDTLVALGVSADSIELKKPENATGTGNDAEARRVEVVLAK
jgi:outer membrane protein OmpA-like peptidoglycan-associated protein